MTTLRLLTRTAALTLLALLPATAALAQTPGVRIGAGTATAADASAALEIVSTDKGLLLPRVASAAAIVMPATGLIVYQTNSPAGFYYNAGDATTPSWQQIATAAGAAITATNGVVKIGQNVGLGGYLTGTTNVFQAGNPLTLTGGRVGIGTAAPTATLETSGDFKVGTAAVASAALGTSGTGNTNVGNSNLGQSFTLATAATVTSVTLTATTSFSTTLTFYQGTGTGGPALTPPQAVSFVANTPLTVTLTAPLVVNAGNYTFALTNNVTVDRLRAFTPSNYAGGIMTSGPGAISTYDLEFALGYYTTGPGSTTLYASSTGGVGIGTTTPGATLDVAGAGSTVRLQGLAGAAGRLLTAATDGTLGTTAAPSGADYVQNQTATDQAASFRIGGDGRVGGNVGIGSTAAPGQRLSVVSADNAASTDIVKVTSLNGASGVSLGYFGLRASGSNANDNLTLDSKGTGHLLLQTGTLGHVGIGTAAPAARLHLYGTATSGLAAPGGTAELMLGSGGLTKGATIQLLDDGQYGGGVYFNLHQGGLQGAPANDTWPANVITALTLRPSGNVGVGTTGPTATLDVNGSTRLRGLTAGVVSAAADGTLSSATAASLDATTATNGLTKTGSALGLGGTLTGATTIAQAGNAFSLTDGSVGIGTTTPAARLQVVSADNATTTTVFDVQAQNLTYGVGLWYGGIRSTGSNTNNALYLDSKGTGNVALNANNTAANVGVGLDNPSQKLDVNGTARLRGLGAGVVSAAADGTLSSSNGGFILNQTAVDQTASFRIGGTGYVGGKLGVGVAAPIQQLEVNGGIRAAANGAFTATSGTNQGAHLQWNRSGSEGETWLINHLGGGNDNAGIRFGGVTTSSGTTVTEWGRFLNNGNLGLGTTMPGQKLDVAGNARISGNVGIGTSLPMATLEVASSLRVGAPSVQVVQPIASGTINLTGGGLDGQSFTLPMGSVLREIDLFVSGTTGTLRLYKGASATGTLLSSQAVSFSANAATTVVLATPVVVTAPGVYSFQLTGNTSTVTQYVNSDVYADGQAYYQGAPKPSFELRFNVRASDPAEAAFNVLASGNVGIGTNTPSTTLDVNGSTRLRGLTAGVVSAAADGTLSSGDGSGSFIQNQTAADQAGGFRLTGNGLIGGNVGIGTATPQNRLDLGGTFGSSPTDAVAKKLAVFNNTSGTAFYGVGVSVNKLHLFADATAAEAPAFTLTDTDRVGIGTPDPTQKLDVRGNLRLGDNGTAPGSYPAAGVVGNVAEFVGPFFQHRPRGPLPGEHGQ